jgi:pimeloyl-ACP methyl ester carboxylesterase
LSPATFVLLHGAFRGGWMWKPVRRRLAAAGHEVFASSLTGAGERAHLGHGGLSMETYITDVVSLLESEDLERVVLVGHSHGGFVAAAASERAAARIGHLVFLDAPVPRDGESAIDMMPAAARAERHGGAPLPDELPPTPLEPGDGLSEADARWANARLTPHPTRPSFDKISLRNPAALALPRTYVFCARTPPYYPSSFTRKRLDDEGVPYRLLDAGHDAPLSAPAAVASLLLEITAATSG